MSSLLASCGKTFLFKEYKDIDPKGWQYDKPVAFDFAISDTNKVYDLILEVTHADSFAYENAYVKVYTTFPDGQTTEQQLSLELSAKNGNWNGQCKGDECKVLINMQQDAVFKQSGKYAIKFEQFGRNENLVGIKKLGFLIEDKNKTKASIKPKEEKKGSQPMPIKKH
jgi:gliding motility-associated lipoprotein GldH